MTPLFRRYASAHLGAVALVMALTGAVVAAQSGPPANAALIRSIDQVNGLDVAGLLRLAAERSPDLAVADAMVAAASGQARQAGLRANPETTLERREQIGGTDSTTAVGFSWALEVGRLTPRRDAAAADRQASEFDRDDAKRRLAAAIRAAYGEILAAARTLTTTEAQLATAANIARLAGERASTGAGAPLDREQAAIEVSLLTRQRYRDELRLETGRLALAQLVGVGPSDPLAVRGTLESVAEAAAAAADSPIGGDASARSDIRAAVARETAARARTRSLRADGRIDVGLFGQYMSMKSSFPQLAFSGQGELVPVAGQFHTLVGGVNLTLPIFNRQQGAVAAAKADETAAARQVDRTRLDADYQVATSRLKVQNARAAVAELRDEALRRARANVDVLQEAYSLGARSLQEVLAEVRRVQQIEIDYTDALLELYQAGVALRAATGDIDRP